MKNVTEEYIHMLSAFEADFDLNGANQLSHLKGDFIINLPYSEKLAKDFELFDKLVWKISHGQVKIMEV